MRDDYVIVCEECAEPFMKIGFEEISLGIIGKRECGRCKKPTEKHIWLPKNIFETMCCCVCHRYNRIVLHDTACCMNCVTCGARIKFEHWEKHLASHA